MVRNVRWLYSKLGTEDFSVTGQSTVSGALSGLNSELGNKSNTSHTHSTGTLPTSSNQVNSTSYVPTSALLYSMKERVDGIQSLVAAAKRVLDDPNKRYESKDLGTWGNSQAADTFLSTYTHENNYEGLSLGNYFTIQDGTYNAQWEIAGFDMEHNQMAADGTVYDNGYGICIIPKTYLTNMSFGDKFYDGYYGTYLHTKAMPNIVTKLRGRLGNHVVNRNVLLSSDNAGYPDYTRDYIWTTTDAALMSVGQHTGVFASHRNKYNDGEANYKMPLFGYESIASDHDCWTRNIDTTSTAYIIKTDGTVNTRDYGTYLAVRPMIYIR